MVCPSCNTYLPEEDLIKTNVKMYGGTAVDYDARCPLCNRAIGHMFWGEFSPLPQFRHNWKPLLGNRGRPDEEAAGPPPRRPEPAEAAAEEGEELQREALTDLLEEEPFFEEVSLRDLPGGPARYYCPHCGKTLPEVLPVERRHKPREDE